MEESIAQREDVTVQSVTYVRNFTLIEETNYLYKGLIIIY